MLNARFTFSIYLLFGPSAFAQEAIPVRVYRHIDIAESVLTGAQNKVSAVFGAAGLQILWVPCPSRHVQDASYAECRTLTPAGGIILNLVHGNGQPDRFSPHTLGSALDQLDSGPSGQGYAYAYHSQAALALGDLAREARNHPASCTISLATILANIIAHELGHLLLGKDSHSAHGIMAARWQWTDFEDMETGAARFTRSEERKLHNRATPLAARYKKPQPPR